MDARGHLATAESLLRVLQQMFAACGQVLDIEDGRLLLNGSYRLEVRRNTEGRYAADPCFVVQVVDRSDDTSVESCMPGARMDAAASVAEYVFALVAPWVFRKEFNAAYAEQGWERP